MYNPDTLRQYFTTASASGPLDEGKKLIWRFADYPGDVGVEVKKVVPGQLRLFKLLQPGDVVIVPTPAWQHLVAATYPGALAVYHREAFQAEQFDVAKLRRFCQALPSGFELRHLRLEEMAQFATDLAPALVYNFRSPEEFMTRGVGLGILHQGKFVSGASSAAVGGVRVEIEIQTHRQFRRRGLARAVAAALILYCLEHGLEPCWDAANEPSAALARQLGFHSTGTYEAYRLKQPEGKSAAS